MLGMGAKQFDPYFIRPDNLDLLLATVLQYLGWLPCVIY